MNGFLRRNLLDFEEPGARVNAMLLLLVAAFFSPNVPMPAPLPAIRAEQLLLAALLPSLFLFYRRHPEHRRPQFIDFAFLALAICITITLIFAPQIVELTSYNLRDPFEVARVVEYWLMFRLAFTVVASDDVVRRLMRVVVVLAIASGVFAIVQYLNVDGFNKAITGIWSDSHNLDGVLKRGRVVGFVGNPNYFGILSGLLLTVTLAFVLLRFRMDGRWRWALIAAVGLSTAGVTLAQSRTAAFALLGAMGLGLLFVLAVKRLQPAYLQAIGVFVVAVGLSVAFAEALPPEFGTLHQRFSLSGLADDPSVTVRVARTNSLRAGYTKASIDVCSGGNINDATSEGHEAAALASTAPADVLARDETRKADVRGLSSAMLRYNCDERKWPKEAADLVPKYIDALPSDPSTGEPYPLLLDKRGFLTGAHLENAADPEGPYYALGTFPNMIKNASFEHRNDAAADWSTAGSVDGRPATTLTADPEAIYGGTALDANIGPTGSLYQLVVFDFPFDTTFTAGIWGRSNSGEDETVLLYLIAQYADGGVDDPFASIEVTFPADGSWTPVSLQFKTPPSSRIFLIQFSVRAPVGGDGSHVTLDGAQLNEGVVSASFPFVVDVDPALLKPSDLAVFADSPIVGVGPRKDVQIGAFDNEYSLFLDRYGILGTLAYLALIISASWLILRGFLLRSDGTVTRAALIALALGMGTYTVAQIAFNIAAGSFYSFQLMAIYWLLIGFLARGVVEARAAQRIRVHGAVAAPAAAGASPASRPGGQRTAE